MGPLSISKLFFLIHLFNHSMFSPKYNDLYCLLKSSEIDGKTYTVQVSSYAVNDT